MNLRAILERLTKRTSRDLAVAGALVGSVAAMGKLFPAMERYTTLRVEFYSDRWQEWSVAPCDDASAPWRAFVKWYHGRPQSDSFVMHHRTGCTAFNRKDIRGYFINYGERESSSISGAEK